MDLAPLGILIRATSGAEPSNDLIFNWQGVKRET